MTLNDRLRVWFQNDAEACHFAEQLWTAIQDWDDLEDEGQCEDRNALLAWLAFGKEYHPFFLRHGQLLRPALLLIYLKWRAANVLDHGSREDVEKSLMLRAEFYGVLHLIAWIIGGDAWAAQVGPEIYRCYGETVDSLWKEFNPCQHP